MPRVVEYLRKDQTSPYQRWFEALNVQAATKVATALLRMELGNTSNIKWFSGIGEYRIDWGPGYRIYLAKEGDTLIILFGGGTKATQPADISRAQALFTEYKARKAESLNGAAGLEEKLPWR